MQFNSFIFILLFLPITIILYFMANKIKFICGKLILLFSSVIFYIYGDSSLFIVLIISLLINYIFSIFIFIHKKWSKFILLFPVLINVGLLVYFKYSNFIITNVNNLFNKSILVSSIAIPIGISFFTFQEIAYIVEIYKGELKSNNFLDYCLFIMYFPKILMGPLMDPVEFIAQINDDAYKKVNCDNLACGIKIFSLGLFKKVMIADIFAMAVDWGYSNIDVASSMDLILVMFFYTIEIYFDFSGYSDMAVGSSLMFNITLPINFDSPYKAISIRDFWKRWHISLTRFFTKYIYIPLGGNKNGVIFTCINTMLVFLISGIWHGANWTFILWGIAHGLLSIFDRLLSHKQKQIFEPARWIFTFLIINVLWLLFRSETVQQWKEILSIIIGFNNLNVSSEIINIFRIQETSFLANLFGLNWLAENIKGFWMIVYFVLSMGICLLFDNNYNTLKKKSYITMVISAVAFVWGIISLSKESVFVYFNF